MAVSLLRTSSSLPTPRNHSRWYWSMVALAFAVGWPLRMWTHQPHLDAFVKTQLDRALLPGDQWRSSGVTVRLANGWRPEVALELHQFQYEQAGCAQASSFATEKLIVPIHLWQLLQGRLAVGTVRVQQGRVHIQKSCDTSTVTLNAPAPTPVRVAIEPSPAPTNTHRVTAAIARLRHALRELQRANVLQGVRIDHLEVVVNDQQTPWTLRRVSLAGLAFNESVDYEGILQFPTGGGWPERLPPINFWGADQGLSLNLEMRGHWREGTVSFLSRLEGEGDEAKLHVRSTLTHLPLFQVGQMMKQLNPQHRELKPYLAWLSCQGAMQTLVRDLSQAHFILAPCQIEGALGRVVIPELSLAWADGLHVAAVKAQLEGVSLDALMDLLHWQSPTRGVVANLGRLSGTLEINDERIAYQGQLAGLDLAFSHLGRRAIQHLPAVMSRVQIQNGRLTGRFLVGGGAEQRQTASFDLAEDLSEGTFQVELQPLSLAREVQQLLFAGQVVGATLRGNGQIRGRQLDHWQSIVEMAELRRKDLFARNVRLRWGVDSLQNSADLLIDSARLVRNAESTRWLEPVLADAAHVDTPAIDFTRIRAQLGISQRVLSWRSVRANFEGGRVLSSNGGWNERGDLRGWVQLVQPHVPLKRWLLGGERSDPRLEATSLAPVELAKTEFPMNSTPSKTMQSTFEQLSSQVFLQIRGWLPRAGREPSTAAEQVEMPQ